MFACMCEWVHVRVCVLVCECVCVGACLCVSHSCTMHKKKHTLTQCGLCEISSRFSGNVLEYKELTDGV